MACLRVDDGQRRADGRVLGEQGPQAPAIKRIAHQIARGLDDAAALFGKRHQERRLVSDEASLGRTFTASPSRMKCQARGAPVVAAK